MNLYRICTLYWTKVYMYSTKANIEKQMKRKKKGADVSGFKIDESISISEAIPAVFRVFQRDA